MRRLAALIFALLPTVFAQKNLAGTAEIEKALDRLNTLGSVLMIAAHPDDENTALIAYFARGRTMRTGYLSLTRGEGGQNLIGSEQGDKIGIIRTQELLAARRIDGGEQYFSRMVDFGFSKNAEETIGKWGRENVLADIVWNIRRFQPDVIVLRFSGTSRDGHGHHQTSALLGKEAVALAADPTKYPEQLQYVQPWQTRRLYFNLFAFRLQDETENDKVPGTLVMDYGGYDPVLGYSYTEIAGQSRSQHRSQGMGAPERKGSSRNHLLPLAGDLAPKDPFDGIDISWSRVPNGAAIGTILQRARSEFDPRDPSKLMPVLAQARPLIAKNTDAWSKRKLAELDETIALCAGIWADVSAEKAEIVQGQTVKLSTNVIARSTSAASFDGKPLEPNRMASVVEDLAIPIDQPLSQPYWLERPKDGTRYRVTEQSLLGNPENIPMMRTIRIALAGTEIELRRPIIHRYVDRVEGEMVRPVAIVPPVAVGLGDAAFVFPSFAPRTMEVNITAKTAKAAGIVALKAPTGWTIAPASEKFSLAETNEQATLRFTVTPAKNAAPGDLRAVASLNGREYSHGIDVIRYPHIPPQTLFPPATAKVEAFDVKTLSKNVGYVMGAGDEVPEALRQIGCRVTLLSAESLAREDLARFDAIVVGVRGYNTRPELKANHQRLMDYVAQGGTMVVQYNVADNRFFGGNQSLGNRLGPYPFQVGGGRVTDEDATVETIADSPLMKSPNAITAEDWKGWIQERGLYYATEWDPRYRAPFRMKDPGEKPQDGSTLVAKHGKGVYIYTSLAWFRQLPAGVPGAYRIFANFLSAAKVMP